MVTTAQHRQQPQSTAFRRVVVPALIVLLGLLVMLYPVVASNWNNYQQQEVAKQYEELMKDTDPELLNQQIEAAHDYNRTKVEGPILDPWLAHVNTDMPEYREYLEQLSGQSAMSQVTIPAIDSKLPLYHGTKEETLQRGLGHLYGTALPVGGESTHAVLTGHTGITNATLWDNLIDVKVGDAIYINTFGEKLKYEVYDIQVVTPDQTDMLGTIDGKDIITLITCTPYGINTHRLLVHAERVPMDPEDETIVEETNGFKMQWWMWAVLGVAALILLGLIWWFLRALRQTNEANTSTQPVEDTEEML
ncbi:class C sortase [Corynebacterium breve]|uniref:Class C sortase n=1 Tax=Corynebacterium breve TaxID=3049799 RepID=A0ABY8VC48_9CORY|nr:class C sortase [Corynebacterium breve]WIM66897.1 class C sortase [Corynebacterium breve]